MDALKKTAKRPGLGAPQNMWRYADVLHQKLIRSLWVKVGHQCCRAVAIPFL